MTIDKINFQFSAGVVVDYQYQNPGCDGCDNNDNYGDDDDDYWSDGVECTCTKIINPHIKELQFGALAQSIKYAFGLTDPMVGYVLERMLSHRPPEFTIKVEKGYSGESVTGVFLKPASQRTVEEMLTHGPAQFLRQLLKEEHANLTLGGAKPFVQKKVPLAGILLPDEDRRERASQAHHYSVGCIRSLVEVVPIAVCTAAGVNTYTVVDGYGRIVAINQTRKKYIDIIVVEATSPPPTKRPPSRGRRLLL